MFQYKYTSEDERYLKNYRIENYERPSVAADIAIFSILGRKEEKNAIRDLNNFRKIPKKELKILLIKRASCPFRDMWALPGGFCQKNEDVYETAHRELEEETGIQHAYLVLSDIYGNAGRDPRGWIMSSTFFALVNGEACHLRAGSDAWEARWFSVHLTEKNGVSRSEKEYTLSLENAEDDEPIQLRAVIRETQEMKYHCDQKSRIMMENSGLAFDHGKIITDTILQLRQRVAENSRIVFEMMPEKFTLTELQRALEVILDQKLIATNFRRKIAGWISETGEIAEGAGHRPAKLFTKNSQQ